MTATSRRTRRLGVIGLSFVAVTAGGCEDFAEFEPYHARRDGVTRAAGDAVKHNMALQTIDPWPKHAWDTLIGLDGQRAVIAAERYRQNKVLEPKGLSTQSVSTEKSGSASGGTPAAK